MPLPFIAYSAVQMLRLFEAMGRGGPLNDSLFLTIAISNILYWAALLTLVVLLAGASDPEPNRYNMDDRTL